MDFYMLPYQKHIKHNFSPKYLVIDNNRSVKDMMVKRLVTLWMVHVEKYVKNKI